TTIRTVFWVIDETPGIADGYRFLLGDPTSYDFHAGGSHDLFDPTWANSYVLNGVTRINSRVVVGTTTNRPTTPSVISLVTTGAVSASSFSNDRGLSRYWQGDLAELIIYDRALSDSEVATVEGYLFSKYGITTPPVPSTPGGMFTGSTSVTLSSVCDTIYYTTNGTDPSTSSSTYSGPITL